MIKLYQFAPAWDVPNLSPFCLKVETFLKMAGLPYEIVDAIPLQGPKGQLPFIEDNGKRIGDSQFIVEYLKKTYGDSVDGHLTPGERAVSNAMQRLIENHLCWAFVFARFGKRDVNWAENKRAIFGGLPPIVRDLVSVLARRGILRQLGDMAWDGTRRLRSTGSASRISIACPTTSPGSPAIIEGCGMEERVMATLEDHRGQVHQMICTTDVPAAQLDEFFLSSDAPLRQTEIDQLGITV